ncbi:unnamed protein product [Protopolystoma xenopodis]|uniref:Uncharacterized protein n=1 Tax=Protopolystoma xenopodis TaxID=117903 RepID=A0A3S5C3P8_9PLAT|nr:unnamed protein product [Protopolystoma xenopodis]
MHVFPFPLPGVRPCSGGALISHEYHTYQLAGASVTACSLNRASARRLLVSLVSQLSSMQKHVSQHNRPLKSDGASISDMDSCKAHSSVGDILLPLPALASSLVDTNNLDGSMCKKELAESKTLLATRRSRLHGERTLVSLVTGDHAPAVWVQAAFKLVCLIRQFKLIYSSNMTQKPGRVGLSGLHKSPSVSVPSADPLSFDLFSTSSDDNIDALFAPGQILTELKLAIPQTGVRVFELLCRSLSGILLLHIPSKQLISHCVGLLAFRFCCIILSFYCCHFFLPILSFPLTCPSALSSFIFGIPVLLGFLFRFRFSAEDCLSSAAGQSDHLLDMIVALPHLDRLLAPMFCPPRPSVPNPQIDASHSTSCEVATGPLNGFDADSGRKDSIQEFDGPITLKHLSAFYRRLIDINQRCGPMVSLTLIETVNLADWFHSSNSDKRLCNEGAIGSSCWPLTQCLDVIDSLIYCLDLVLVISSRSDDALPGSDLGLDFGHATLGDKLPYLNSAPPKYSRPRLSLSPTERNNQSRTSLASSAKFSSESKRGVNIADSDSKEDAEKLEVMAKDELIKTKARLNEVISSIYWVYINVISCLAHSLFESKKNILN